MTTDRKTSPWTPQVKVVTSILLLVWAGLAALLGVTESVTTAPGQAFGPVMLTAAVPVLVFLLAYGTLSRFRSFVLAQDIAQLTSLQHWRVVGFGFLLLYAHDALPALFAFPAGVGDVLVGLAAPLIVTRLARDPRFQHSRRFVTYHVLGLLDFVVAVGASALASGAFPAIWAGPLTSAPMEVWPLILFPAFIVPIFIMLHLSVFLKLRALRREADSRVTSPGLLDGGQEAQAAS